jgi:hypothetical protein
MSTLISYSASDLPKLYEQFPQCIRDKGTPGEFLNCVRIEQMHSKVCELEREAAKLHAKVDTANRNCVTAGTVAGAAVGVIAGIGASVATAGAGGVAYGTAIACGVAGGAGGAGVGNVVGEILVQTKHGDTK